MGSLRLLLGALIAVSCGQAQTDSSGRPARASVEVVTVESAINQATSDFIGSAIEHAHERGRSALVVRLNTPGGILKSTRVIVSLILEAELPVIVYVSPGGAQAASAGVFITLAGHLAVMAPGTNIGAAHPVAMGQEMDSVMSEKATNDAAAFIRSISEKRHRNIEWAEEAVRKSVAISETEARNRNVIDFVAADVAALLDSADGRVVSVRDRSVTLSLAGAAIIPIEKTFQQEFLDIISDPNIAYILMMLGMYGLLFELYNPGSIFPGVVGVIALLLAFYSLHTLPVNYAGLGLVIFSVILFLLEVKIVSHGLLAIGGVISLVTGSLLLFEEQSLFDAVALSWSVIAMVAALTTAFFIFAIGAGIRAQRRKPTTGIRGMEDEVGVAFTDLDPAGQVKVHGEIWNASSSVGFIAKGEQIVVEHGDGLRLTVRKPRAAAP